MIIQKIKRIFDLISNMGMVYVFFRILYSIKTKLGWKKKVFPTNIEQKKYISFESWKKNLPPFFFHGKEINGLEKKPTEELQNIFENIKKGTYLFFSKSKIDIGLDYDWITNPISKYKYDINKHWSEIKDLSNEAGDIKYVWEKSRFTFLNDIIRYDYHHSDDQSKFVFNQIEDFIDKNPINQGPNYVCSQEISLRILNWTFALYYYKDSEIFSEELFYKIMHSVYCQIQHVYKNINFSRISVRNNHAITETLSIYISGKIFPFFPDVKSWSKKAKKWFENEINYQIYDDGTHLQYSTNYHRVVIQLLTIAIKFSKIYNDPLDKKIYDKAKKSIEFLTDMMDIKTGYLPNVGANDGSLFFNFSSCDYRDYRPQINDLHTLIYNNTIFNSTESLYWHGIKQSKKVKLKQSKTKKFPDGGFFILNDNDQSKTVVKCTNYTNRPSQADNNHLDIWLNGKNYFRDNGSFLYNTQKKYINFFNGTVGHNTCTIENENQMLKGPRFIWFYWVKISSGEIIEYQDRFEINTYFIGFKNLGKNIEHHRKTVKFKNKLSWEIIDYFKNAENFSKQIFWHTNTNLSNQINLEVYDLNLKKINSTTLHGMYSPYYGYFERSSCVKFESKNGFKTMINIT